MDQSSVIGAALVVAYVVFVISKGELPCWLQILGIPTGGNCSQTLQQACSVTGSTTSGTGTGGTLSINPGISGGSGSGGININLGGTPGGKNPGANPGGGIGTINI